MMNTGEDESSSGLNGRLRPRKPNAPSLSANRAIRKLENKTIHDKHRRTNTPSKAPPNKPDDLATKSDSSSNLQLLCPYCERKFASKQTLSKHVRRIHFSISKQDSNIGCLFCNHFEAEAHGIIQHMVDSHPNQYFACLECHSRFFSTSELAEHKLNVCEKQKLSYRSKLRQKVKKNQNSMQLDERDVFQNDEDYSRGHGYNGIVISCELKPSEIDDDADIEENITTNLILPPSKSLGNNAVLEKSAVIVLDDIQWNKRISFHNTDADQILSRLGVVHRSPRTSECNRREWFKVLNESTLKFEKCFDTSFYSKVASNVQENLNKFLDGSFNFNPDPDSTIKTRKTKNSVAINTAEGFPILLACEQYSRNVIDTYLPRPIAPKHKWKWDSVESVKNITNSDLIKGDSHANNCIITLVSSLDIWTQLCMRRKFEDKFNKAPVEKRIEKENLIGKELKEILESREIPISSSQIVKHNNKPLSSGDGLDFPASLGLIPSVPKHDIQPAVLSGEWVRPRCYVCCACGAQTRDSRALSSHIFTQHPNAQVQHYEIVGELLLNADILKHLYVPPSQMCNRTRPLRGFRECTKCKKSVTLEDLHQHMLDCAGDMPAVRRKCRYRPFGVRRRRPRLPDNTIRKKMRKDMRSRQTRSKSRMRPRAKIRTEVGDAETIRKMLADLPAKRHRVMINPLNPTIKSRPRRKIDHQRNKLIMKKRSDDTKKGKQRVVKDTNNAVQAKVAGHINQSNDNHSNGVSKDDNRDIKDMKPPKLKIKRVAKKSARHNEVLKKKTVANRPQRKVVQTKKSDDKTSELADHLNAVVCSSSVQTEELSIGNNAPQKIDVNGGPYNTREHSSRGNSNNRNGQHPSSSQQNGTSNNSSTPTQNVPLKHSIARLTASSETHDKSVQFHQMFLIQQECNNVNQHVPTEQRLLFEKEAVVTKLDKPPLHFQRGPLDPYTFQKCKMSRPRKGLNDCIAMLRNKLIDPDPNHSGGHISVQCGSDEPLYLKPTVSHKAETDTAENVSQKSSEAFTRRNSFSETLYQLRCESNEIQATDSVTHRSRDSVVNQLHDLDNQQCQEKPINHENPINLPLDVTMLQQNQLTCFEGKQSKHTHEEVYDKRESTLTRSMTRTEDVPIQPQSKEIIPGIEIIPQKSSPRANSPKDLISKKPAKEVLSDRERDFIKKVTSDIPHVDNEAYLQSVQVRSELEQSIFYQAEDKESSHNVNTEGIEAYINKSINGQQSDAFIETTSLCSQFTKKPSSMSPDISLSQQNLIETYSDSELHQNSPVSIELYATRGYSQNIPTGMISEIPPAHASTNVESIVSTPLDLSGKCLNICNSQSISEQDDLYICNYENYETLDLSKKSFHKVRSSKEINLIIEDVVDLRIRPSSHLVLEPRTIDLSVRNGVEDVTDLSFRRREEDNSPTDLSLRGKDKNNFIDEYGNRTNSLHYAQDLSNNKTKALDEINTSNEAIIVDEDSPTDLSGKGTVQDNKTVDYIAVSDFSGNHMVVCYDGSPTDLSGTRDIENRNDVEINSEVSTSHSKVIEYDSLINRDNRIRENISELPSVTENKEVKNPDFDSTVDGTHFVRRSISEPKSTNTSIKEATVGMKINTSVSDYKKSPNTAFSIQDTLPYPIVTTICTISGAIPDYALSTRTTCTSLNRVESTNPVYTLANACISITKIDSSNSAILTNTLLSIPSTTIANTTSVYTLAGTTIGTPANYEVNSGTQIGTGASNISTTIFNSIETRVDNHYNTTVDNEKCVNTKTRNNVISTDQDPETARKIAMLPKELVEILGSMPVDHRNQLLNVLPQYVSTSTASTDKQDEVSNSITTSKEHKMSITSLDNKNIALNEHANITSSSQYYHSPNVFLSSQTQETCNFDNKFPMHYMFLAPPPPPPPPPPLPLSPPPLPPYSSVTKAKTKIKDSKQFVKKSQYKKEDCTLETHADMESFANNGNSDSEYENKVIDLTDDDYLHDADTPNSIEEVSCSSAVYSQEHTESAVPKQYYQKSVNKDQTASLRAVRIKTPSERKSMSSETIALNETSKDLLSKSGTTNNHNNNEIDKLINPSKCMETQESQNMCNEITDSLIIDTKSPLKIHNGISTSTNQIITKDDAEPNCQKAFIKTNLSPPLDVMFNNLNSENNVNDEDTECNTVNNETLCVSNDNMKSPNSREMLDGNVSIESHQETTSDAVPVFVVTSTPKLKTNMKENTFFSKKDINNEMHEEDSDDDITLAFIVKQRQIVQQNMKSQDVSGNIFHVNDTLSEKCTKKRNIESNTKETEKQVINEGAQQEHDIENNNDTDLILEDCFTDDNKGSTEEDLNGADGNDKQSKKKCRKGRRTCLNDPAEQQIGIVQKTVQYEFEINKENDDIVSDNDKNKKNNEILCEEALSRSKPIDQQENSKPIPTDKEIAINEDSGVDVSMKKVKSNDDVDVSTNSNDAIHVQLDENSTIDKVIDITQDRDNSTQNKESEVTNDVETYDSKIIVPLIEFEQLNETDKLNCNELNINEKDRELVDIDEKELNSKSIEIRNSQNFIKLQYDPYTIEENHNTVSNCGYKRSKTSIRSKKLINFGVSNDHVSTETDSPIEEKSIIPLRRSRRGKSLSVDNNLIEHEDGMAFTSTLEMKTPLTKKQLIFSKLLLDEENSVDQSESQVVKKVVKHDNSTDLPHTCKESVTVSHNDKSKSTKRKKSLRMKRNCKKKKSYHMSQAIIDESANIDSRSNADLNAMNITDNTLEKDNINSKQNQLLLEVHSGNKKEEFKDDAHYGYDINKLPSPAEKRKISKLTSNLNTNHSSKTKRSRFSNKYEFSSVSCINEQQVDDMHYKIKFKHKSHKVDPSEIRVTCYNKPLAARRTRSKSIAVKSSDADMYDPYDIDLDDMIEKPELFEKRTKTSDKVSNNNNKPVNLNCTVTSSSKKSSKMKSSVISKEIDKPKVSEISYAAICNKNEYKVNKAKGNLSDSDTSSMSDVPLKKYVEQKEKKILKYENRFTVVEKESDNIKTNHKVQSIEKQKGYKSKRNSTLFKDVEGDVVLDKTDEQRRSERFMESFGFFSERKPRKSNLLATKKISETFHIIANESDDVYFGFKGKSTKKSVQIESRRKSYERDRSKSLQMQSAKKGAKQGNQKKIPKISFCSTCRKEFRRPDNYLRHQISLFHISKVSQVELKFKTAPIPEEPNYLIAYKEEIEKIKILKEQLTNQKKKSKSGPKIKLPTVEEILANVNKTVREQQLARRNLSRDEALFLDCCELLKESHKPDVGSSAIVEDVSPPTREFKGCVCPIAGPIITDNSIEKIIGNNKCDTKSESDMDSISAKNILESEEVRNLENDLISGLKAAASASGTGDNRPAKQGDSQHTFSNTSTIKVHPEQVESLDVIDEPHTSTNTNKPKIKDKMYPDIFESIDMFEDKFDKIKRKSRSQAVAAKQIQSAVECNTSSKSDKRKKPDRKKARKCYKRSHQNTVLTKGALKGFDGIKVSIPTSDINMSAIVTSLDPSGKRKKRNGPRKKRDRRDSESSSKYESDHRTKDSIQRKLDVYEFMDNDDAELFEFRPSTLMERFKNMNSKDASSISNEPISKDAPDNSTGSASDGDDFVYMSDDYVCSGDETENSLMSCEMGSNKTSGDTKKNSPAKRKDVVEKNAVMGKIFKNNAVRSEKKSTKSKEPVKPKANLDQLFDSLLEDEPNSSVAKDGKDSLAKDVTLVKNYDVSSPKHHEISVYEPLSVTTHDEEISLRLGEIVSPKESNTTSPTKCCSVSPKKLESTSTQTYDRYPPKETHEYGEPSTFKADPTTKQYHGTKELECKASTSRKYDEMLTQVNYGASTSKCMYDTSLPKDYKAMLPKKCDNTSFKRYNVEISKGYDSSSSEYGDSSSCKRFDFPTLKDNHSLFERYQSKAKPSRCKSPVQKFDEGASTSFDYSADLEASEDTGVARQRARRKCTVGKQNVLAETWSSESEPEPEPPSAGSAAPRPSPPRPRTPTTPTTTTGRSTAGSSATATRSSSPCSPTPRAASGAVTTSVISLNKASRLRLPY